MICYLVEDQDSPYYQSDVFTRIINHHNGKDSVLKPVNGKPCLVVEKITNPEKALNFLKKIYGN